jgi:hypothetical protein
MKQLILILTLLMTSCGTSDNGGGISSSSPATTAPTPNAQGELLATVNSATGATISASQLTTNNDPLSQFTSVEIPAGALSKSIDVKVFETSSLAPQIAPEFGVTEVKKAGPALVIQGDSSALTSEITVSVPYSSSASLNLADEQIAVLALSDTTMTLYHGGQIIVGNKIVSVKVKRFGAFQVVRYSGFVQQQKATVQVSEASLKTVTAAASAEVTPTPTPTPTVPTPTPTPTPSVVAEPVVSLIGKWVTECFPLGMVYGKDMWVITSTSMRLTEQVYSDAACTQLVSTAIHPATYSTGTVLASGATPINIVFAFNTRYDIYQIANDNNKVCFGEGDPTDGSTGLAESTRRSTLDNVCYTRASSVVEVPTISSTPSTTALTLAELQGTYYHAPIDGQLVEMTLVISGNTAQMTSTSTTTYQFTLGTTLSGNGTTPFYIGGLTKSIKKVNGAIMLPDIYPNYVFDVVVQ